MHNQVATKASPSYGIGTRDARDWVRVVGNSEKAYIETAPAPFQKDNKYFETQRVQAQVLVNPHTGVTQITTAQISAQTIKVLELEFRRALLDARVIEPEKAIRYRVGFSYVTLDRVNAERLSEITTGGKEIKVTQGVEIIHSTFNWALWSDHRITTAIGLPKWATEIKTISKDAESILSLYWGADCGDLPDTVERVAQVEKILSETTEKVELNGSRFYAPPRIVRMRVQFTDRTETDWWLSTQGYSEGYEYSLYASKEDLLAAHQPVPTPGPAYVPMQGQLWEPCEKCGAEPIYLPLHLCTSCWPKPTGEK